MPLIEHPIKKGTFTMLKQCIASLGVGNSCFIATLEPPDESKVENYQSFLKLIEEHTDLKYNLEVKNDGFNLKRLK